MSNDLETLDVKRTIFDAGAKLIEAAKHDKRGLEDWNLADEKRGLCREAGNNEEADFWYEVYQYLMTLECMHVKVTVIEGGAIISQNQASEILARMYAEGAERKEKALSIHLFAITYADEIQDMSLEEIAIGAGLPKSYKTELRKGINLAKYVEVKV